MTDKAPTIRDLQRQLVEQEARFQREVVERERAEQALRESEAQYRQLVELAPDLISVHRDGKILFINQAGLQLIGATNLDQVVGKPVVAFVKEKNAARKRMRRLLKEGDRSPVYEHKLLRLDGTEIDIEITGTRFVYQGKHAVQIIARDVTRRKQAVEELEEYHAHLEQLVDARTAELTAANEQLRESEEKLRAQYKNIPIPTYTWQRVAAHEEEGGQDFELVDYNDAAAAITQGKIAGWVGIRASVMYGDELDDFLRCFAEKTSVEREMLYHYQTTGESKHLAIKYAYVPPDQVLVHTEDITERRQTEDALREAELCYRTVADFTYDWEYWENSDGTLRYVSPSCERVTGYPVEWFMDDAHSLSDLILPQDREIWAEHRHATQDRGAQQVQFRIQNRDGETHWIEHLCQPVIDEDGTFLGYRASNRDVTERKRVEKTLREHKERLQDLIQERTADLEDANEQLYQANTELSHEITKRELVEEALRQRNLDLLLLNQAGRTFSSTLDLDQVLAKVLETVRDLLGILDGSIWLLDEQTGELVCRYLSNPRSEGILGWRLSLEQGVAGWAAKNGKSVLVENTQEDARYFADVAQHVGIEVGSLLTTPLWDQQAVFGVLQVVDAEPGRFNISDLHVMEALAATASIAIRNARLYAQTRRDAETKAVLLEEVNHRVRNNLVSIMGILSLEMGRPHPQAASLEETLQGVQDRIRGLATVHNLLSSVQWSPLHLDRMVLQVIQAALGSSPIANQIKVEVTPLAEPLLISSKQATGLALIINELTTNSIKHAFRDCDRGRIDVRIAVSIGDRDGDEQPGKARYKQVTLEFRDDGPGWPDDVLQGQRENVGLNLIRLTVRSPLRGQLVLSNGDDAERPGALAKLTFRHISTRPAEQVD